MLTCSLPSQVDWHWTGLQVLELQILADCSLASVQHLIKCTAVADFNESCSHYDLQYS